MGVFKQLIMGSLLLMLVELQRTSGHSCRVTPDKPTPQWKWVGCALYFNFPTSFRLGWVAEAEYI